MTAAEKQQHQSQEASPDGENAAHVANQVSSKSTRKQLSNGVEKVGEGVQSELYTAENKDNTAKEAATRHGNGAEDATEKNLRSAGSVGSVEADPVTGDSEKDIGDKQVDLLVAEETPVPVDIAGAGGKAEKDAEMYSESMEQIGAKEGSEEGSLQSREGAGDGEAAVPSVGDDAASKEPVVAVEVGDSEKTQNTVVDGSKSEGAAEATSLPVEEVRSAIVTDVVAGNDDKKMEEEVLVYMEVNSGDREASVEDTAAVNEKDTIKVSSAPQKSTGTTVAAVQSGEVKGTIAGDPSKDVEMAVEDEPVAGGVLAAAVERTGGELQEVNTAVASRLSNAVTMAVGQIVTTLVDDVVGFVDETVHVDAESVKILSSPMMPHLSADEAMELLEVHQGDDHDLLPEHEDGADADVEAEPTESREYQWFDGDDDDDEGVAIEAPSALDVIAETTDDVFGFGGVVGLTDVTQNFGENTNINSDESGDTLVIPGNSSSSSSSSSSSASSRSSSSSSSSSSVSSSEDESVGRASKKRRASGSNGPRKLLKYKKQKRVRSSEPEKPSRGRYKRKRKIPNPVIPPEFAVFDVEAADPILKGSYAVRNNRHARFVGDWGFSDEAFSNTESVSPFQYTSRARVLQSRRKDDKRPVSGKYGGFFKLRQFNGTLVKIREDQVDLQFLPMPSSDGEDENEDMEGYESDESDEGDGHGDGHESAASRYIVLGKGKNRFGRFLIRGYLNPESGRLTVKRRYLE